MIVITVLSFQAASLVYSTVPTASYEEALTDFLAAYKERPEFIENLVYIGRCCIELKKKDMARKYLEEALRLQPKDKSEEEFLAEAKKLLNKC